MCNGVISISFTYLICENFSEDVWKVLFSTCRLLDPPKSPLKRGTLRRFPPFFRGARGDPQELDVLCETFQTSSQKPGFLFSSEVYYLGCQTASATLTGLVITFKSNKV